MGARRGPGERCRSTRRRAGAIGERPAVGGGRRLTLLIREGPATELTVATRILAHLGLIGPDGAVAAVVGGEVVYVPGRGVSAATMTPYDVCAVRLADGLELAGTPPGDLEEYLAPLRADRTTRAVALSGAARVTAPGLEELVERLSRLSWAEAEAAARAAGALVGAYPADG